MFVVLVKDIYCFKSFYYSIRRFTITCIDVLVSSALTLFLWQAVQRSGKRLVALHHMKASGNRW